MRVVALLMVLLTGCAAGGFTPKTLEGAQCKSRCAEQMAACRAAPITCDRAVATCMTTCKETEALQR